MAAANARLTANLGRQEKEQLKAVTQYDGLLSARKRLQKEEVASAELLSSQMAAANERLTANLGRQEKEQLKAVTQYDVLLAARKRLQKEEVASAELLASQMAAANDRLIANMTRLTAAKIAAQVADEKVANANAIRNGTFASASPASRLATGNKVLGALEAGASEASVLTQYGSAALLASKNLSSLESAVVKTAPAMKGFTVDMNDAHAAARGLAGGFGQLWLTYGSVIPLVAGAALAFSFKTALEVGAKFVDSLYVLRELAGSTSEEVGKLSAAAMELGRTSQYGPLEVAKGMEILALAGLRASEVLIAIKPTLNFASAGGVTAEKAAETLVAVSTAYGYTAEGFASVGDIIAKTAADSMASVESMSESFRSSSIVAQQYGVTLEDMAKNLIYLSQIGVQGSAAGTSVRNYYSELAKESGKVPKSLEAIGVSAIEADGRMRPMLDTMEALSVAASKLSAKAQNELFQNISNERGGKTLAGGQAGAYRKLNEYDAERMAKEIADGKENVKTIFEKVDALKAAGKQAEATALSVKTLTETYARMRSETEKGTKDTAGMAFFADLEKKLTPLAQFKGILASLQTDFVQAFTGAEASIDGTNGAITGAQDALFILGGKVKAVFESEGFRQGVASMVSGLTSIITSVVDAGNWIAEHSKILLALGSSYLIASTLTKVYAAAQVLAAGATAASTLAVQGNFIAFGLHKAAVLLSTIAVRGFTAVQGLAAAVTSGVVASAMAGNVVALGATATAYGTARLAALAFQAAVVTFGVAAVAAGGYAAYLGFKYLFIAESAEEASARTRAADIASLTTSIEANAIRMQQTLDSVNAENNKYQRLEELRVLGITGEAAATRVAGDLARERIEQDQREIESRAKLTLAQEKANIAMAQGSLDSLNKYSRFVPLVGLIAKPAISLGQAYIDRQTVDAQAKYEKTVADARVASAGNMERTTKAYSTAVTNAEATAKRLADAAKLAGQRFEGTGGLGLQKDKGASAKKIAAEGFKSLAEEEDKSYANTLKTMKQAFVQQQAATKADLDTRKINQGEFYAASIINQAKQEQSELAALLAYDAKKKAAIQAGKANDKDPVQYEADRAKNLSILATQTEEATKQIKQLAAARMLASQNTLEKTLSDEAFALSKLSLSVDEYLVQLKLKADADTAAAGATASERARLEAVAAFTAKYSEDMAKQTIVVNRNKEVYQSLGVAMMDAQLANNPEAYLELKGSFDEVGLAIEKAASKLDEFKGKVTSGASVEGINAAQKQLVKEFDETNTALKDSIANAIFDGAKAGGANLKSVLRKSIEEFAKQKFRIAIDAVLNPITSTLTSFLNPSAGAAAGGGIGAVGGGIGAAGGLGSSIASLSSSATALYSAASYFASGATGSMVGAAAGLGATLPGSAAGIGALAGTGAAGMAGTVGAALAAIGPVGWAAIAAGTALALFGGKKESASKSTGSLERSYDASGAITSERSPFAIGNGAQMVDSLYARFNGLQQVLMGKGGASFGYGAYSGTGDKNPMGRIAGGAFNSGEIPTAELGLAASRAILAALQASEMPKGIAAIINSLDVSKASEDQIKALQEKAVIYAQSIKSIIDAIEGSPLNSLKGMAFETADALVVAAGGLESFNNGLKSYYDNFYSAEEKRIQTIAEITKKLNAAGAGLTTDQVGGMNRADFRAKFEAPNNSLELNAALLSVAGAFASITSEATSAVAGITAISDTLKSLNKDSSSLQADILELQGKTAEAEKVRFEIATEGYGKAEIAAYKYNAEMREEIKTRQAASAEYKTLQERLATATDTTAEAATRARNAINPLNLALYDFVTAAEAAKTAAATQTSLVQKYAEPINATSAAATLGVNFMASILGKSSDQIRDFVRTYAASLDTQTVAGRAAIAGLEKLTPAFDFFASAAEGVAQRVKTATESFNANIGGTLAKFKTPTQNRDDEYNNIATSLKAGGFANKDNAGLVDVLKSADKSKILSLAQTIFDGLGAGAGEAKEELRKLVDRLADLKNAEVSAVPVIESVTAAYGRLTNAIKTNEQIAQERISLESRLHAATDTTAEAMARVKATIDPLNQALFDLVTAAEAAKAATATQVSLVQKYTAPVNAASAAADLGPTIFASITGKSADQIREFALSYVSSLNAQTESGRAAIASFEKLTPALDFFATAAEGVAQVLVEAIKTAVSAKEAFTQKYAAPINAESAKTVLGPSNYAAIAGKSADQIREMARVYVTSLDSQTAAGRSAIKNFEKLTPALDFFATAAEGVAQVLAEAIKTAASAKEAFTQKYAAPINVESAKTLLGPSNFAAIAGKSADQIREMARVYVTSLDSQTAAGRAAIKNFEKLTPAIDFFATAAVEAEAAIERAAEAAVALARTRVGMEVTLLQLSGNATLALARQRAIELELMDVSLRPLQLLINAQTDLNTANELAKNGLLQATQKTDEARSNLTAAYERESSALQTTIDKFAGFSKSLLAFRDSLITGSLSTLSPEQKYLTNKAKFDSTSALAEKGDETAMGELQGVSQQFLDSSRDYNASTSAYASDFEAVKAGLSGSASAVMTQAGTAQTQLTALQASVAGLLTVNGSVLSVSGAIAALTSAQELQAEAQLEATKTATAMALSQTRAGSMDLLLLQDIKKNTNTTSVGVGSLKDKFDIELVLDAETTVTDYLTVHAIALTASERDTALAELEDVKRNIKLIADTVSVADREIALEALANVSRTIRLIAATISAAERETALEALANVSRTIRLVAETLTEAEARTALEALNNVTRTIALVVVNLSGDQRDNAIRMLDNVTRAISLTVTELTGVQKEIALDTLNNITKIVSLAVTLLSGVQVEKALEALNGVTKTIALAVVRLTDDQRETALSALQNITKSIGIAVVKLTDDQRDIALATLNNITKTIALAAVAVSETERNTALKALDYLSRAVALTLTQFSSSDQNLILQATTEATKTIAVALGTSDAKALALALATSTNIYRTLEVAGGVLTTDQRSMLNAVAYGSTTVALSASGAVTWNESAPLKSVFDAINSNTYTLSSTLSTISNNWSPLFTGMHTALAALNQAGATSSASAGLRVRFDRGTTGTYGSPGGSLFANGGAFTNGIVSRPTSFNMGTMGEAGPEAIMPLTNVGGQLGVKTKGGNDNAELAKEIRELKAAIVAELRADKTQRAAVSDATLEKLDILATKADATKRELARV